MMNVALLHAKEGMTSLAFKVTRLGAVKVTGAGKFVNVLVSDEMSNEVILRGKIQVTVSANKNLD